MAADRSLDSDVRPSAFFEAVFADGADAGCNKEGIDGFQKVFVKTKETGEWSGEKMTVYDSIGDDPSFLFAFDKSGKAFKIDTDFLTKNELKDSVRYALSFMNFRFVRYNESFKNSILRRCRSQ